MTDIHIPNCKDVAEAKERLKDIVGTRTYMHREFLEHTQIQKSRGFRSCFGIMYPLGVLHETVVKEIIKRLKQSGVSIEKTAP